MATNRLLRETLARLIARKGDFKIAGVSAHVPDAFSLIDSSGADVLILDSASARLSDCALISQMSRQNPAIKIVLIDMEDDPEIFLECVRDGAVGYLLKDASAGEVVCGVRAVAQGKAICPPQLCAYLCRALVRGKLYPSSLHHKHYLISEKTYSRWCCIDRLGWHLFSECGFSSYASKSHVPPWLIIDTYPTYSFKAKGLFWC